MHPDVVWILNQADNDLGLLGKNDGILEAAAYLDELAKGHPDREEFTHGVTDAADAARYGTENDDWYNREAEVPKDLSYNADLLIAAIDEARQQLRKLGHDAAVELVRELYDNSEEVGVEEPDRDNYWEKDDDGQDYIDEETYNLDLDTYNEAREYLAGVAFAASSLIVRFGVDPDPSWEPS